MRYKCSVREPIARHVRHEYRLHFADPRRERLFLSSCSFFGTFAATRGITHAIRRGAGPFRNLSAGGVHLHHLVFGIAGLLGTGYVSLLRSGSGRSGDDDLLSRGSAIVYGAASALTLDEFALWLKLKDVYWAREGRESVDAVVLFGAALSIGVWGGPFLRHVAHDVVRGRSVHSEPTDGVRHSGMPR